MPKGRPGDAVREVAKFVLNCEKITGTPVESAAASLESPPALRRLQINVCTENTASIELALRLGATQEGVLREYELLHGRHVDHVCFSVLASDLVASTEE